MNYSQNDEVQDFRVAIEATRQHIIQLIAKMEELGMDKIDYTAYAALNRAECDLCI